MMVYAFPPVRKADQRQARPGEAESLTPQGLSLFN
jgi:hypothetical protein